jgi:16S rRNA processing protein RimM
LKTPEPSKAVAAPGWDALVTVGRIARPQGRRGEVIVASETDFGEERFKPGSAVHVTREGRVDTLTVSSSREHDGRWVLGFAGVDSIDAAETLRGLELRVPENTLQPLEPGRYYVHDLVGCRMETPAGEVIGVVARVEFGGGAPALVADDAGSELMVPMVDAICRRVDVAAKVIVVDPPAGLLEVNRRASRDA